MDKKEYFEIRKSFQFRLQSKFLFQHYCLDSILLAAIYFLNTQKINNYFSFLSIPLIAVFLFRQFSLMHESVHNLISKNKKLNDIVGVIAGGICLLPYQPWKEVHLQHHFWSGNIDRDPVMALFRIVPQWNPKFEKTLASLWKLWLPVLAPMQYTVFWVTSIMQVIKSPYALKSTISVLAPIILWSAVVSMAPQTFLLSILLPSILFYFLMNEVVNLPHHVGFSYLEGDKRYAVWEQHETARSCVYPVWLSKFVALNFNYHIEHHMYPDAPWYVLDQLHLKMKTALHGSYNSDLQFEWILKNRSKTLLELFTPAAGAELKNYQPTDRTADNTDVQRMA